MLVIRCESALLYFNVEYVRERLFEILRARPDAVRLVVFFLGAVPNVDLAGAELLADLHRTFGAQGIDFRVADAHGDVRDALRRSGFEQQHGPIEVGPDRGSRHCAVAGVSGGTRRFDDFLKPPRPAGRGGALSVPVGPTGH